MTECIESQGIILNLTPYGESSATIDIFSKSNGLIRGYVKGARQKRHAGIYQKGNLIEFTHKRRVCEQLGTLYGEPISCLWEKLSYRRVSFKIFNTLCDLLVMILPPFVYEPHIYKQFQMLIEKLDYQQDDLVLYHAYNNMILLILQEMGFAPDFTQCAVSASKIDLLYVSPKTGHTICHKVGQAYAHRLLSLPQFLCDQNLIPTLQDLKDALRLMQFYYDRFIFEPQGKRFNLCIMQP